MSMVRLTATLASLMLPAVVVGAITVQPVQAQTYKVLYTFQGAASGDGSGPQAGLVRDSSGNLYGTTTLGGGLNRGTVFKVEISGHTSVLHYFRGRDGAEPLAGLIRDPAGNLYGTTWSGGASGFGTVFKVRKTGKGVVLYAFKGGATDGRGPLAGLVRDASGNLYGTTFGGGTSNLGVVFRLDPIRTETVRYSFLGGTDGWGPEAGLVRDSAGNLYGTTGGGGASGGYGTVFKLDPSGIETVLYAFAGGMDGINPQAGVVRDAWGNLYGTTSAGGDLTCNCGTVFKLDTAGTETVLYRFTGTDGSVPVAGVVRDAKGNLYGTTSRGGAFGYGTVFKLDKADALTVLHSFTRGADGATPNAGLVFDTAGNLYGTASQGGAVLARSCRGPIHGCGVVFEIIP
jgi:uncharacterized repeat protein (TIGR03803 family)